jgi:peroxiredoxin
LPSAVERVKRARHDRGFTVLAVDLQESAAKVSAWARDKGLTMPILLDADGKVSAAYGVRATPTAVLIGRDGRMVARATGTKPWDGAQSLELIDALLARPAP